MTPDPQKLREALDAMERRYETSDEWVDADLVIGHDNAEFIRSLLTAALTGNGEPKHGYVEEKIGDLTILHKEQPDAAGALSRLHLGAVLSAKTLEQHEAVNNAHDILQSTLRPPRTEGVEIGDVRELNEACYDDNFTFGLPVNSREDAKRNNRLFRTMRRLIRAYRPLPIAAPGEVDLEAIKRELTRVLGDEYTIEGEASQYACNVLDTIIDYLNERGLIAGVK